MISFVGIVLVVAIGWYFWERSHRKTQVMSGGLHPDITLPHNHEWELYHNNFSLCSKKARVCLAELGIEYRAHHVDLIETGCYENISRDYLKINPGALVPVLVHNGHPVYESHEQIIYAAAHANEPFRLVPDNEVERALMEHWVHLSSLIGDDPIKRMNETAGNAVPGLTLPIFATMIESIPFHKIFEGLLFHRVKQRALFFLLLKFRGASKLPQTAPLMRVIVASRSTMQKYLDELEKTLLETGGPWIVGEQFTLADVGMMVIFDRLREADWLEMFLTDSRPTVTAYWQALQARSSYQAAVLDFNHPGVTRGTARLVELKQHDPAFRSALIDS